MYPESIPAGYAPIAIAAEKHRRSLSGVRLLVSQKRVGAIKLRNRVYVLLADLDRLEQPQPISASLHAA